MKLKHFGLILLIILVMVSCARKSERKGVDFSLKIQPDVITDFHYVKLTYNFKISDGFKSLDDEYKVFVHFWRKKTKDMLIQDDHSPEKPFSQWKVGDTVSYARTIFLSQFIDENGQDFGGYEEVKLTVGIYKPSDNKSSSVLTEQVLQIQPSSLNNPVMYDEGWYQKETDLTIKNTDEQTWRWTGKKAVCVVENPRKEALLIIRGGVDKALIPDQKIKITVNNTVLEEFIPDTAKYSKRYVISPETMGNEDQFRLIIETDKTFIPSSLNKEVKDSKDNRELGAQIFFLYFRENIK